MATVSQGTIVPVAAQQLMLQYAENCNNLGNEVNLTSNMRAYFERIDQHYYGTEADPIDNTTQAKLISFNNKNEIDNFKVPLVQTQVESAHSYLVEAFLTGFPIFGVVANKDGAEAASQIEAIMAQHEKSGWACQMSMWFRDGLRYNISFLEAEWAHEYIPSLDASITGENGVAVNTQRWQGNIFTRWDPYNTFWDPRVPIARAHIDGEYVGHHELWSRIKLKKFVADQKKLGYIIYNKDKIFKSVNNGRFQGVYYPNTKAGMSENVGEMDWVTFGGLTKAARAATSSFSQAAATEQDQFVVTTMYARIIPEDFSLTKASQADYPQVWKIIIVNGAHILMAYPLTNAHNYLPVFCCQPHDENLSYAAKSMADTATGFQNVASALWKIALNGARRHLTDRAIYDPSKIDKTQINNPNPSAKIPLRPAAYGTDIRSAFAAIPTQNFDPTVYIGQAQEVFRFANMANGQNQASQGQFVKGNKTKAEYSDIMGNSTARNRQYALSIEYQALVPLKYALLYNILQYQPVETLFNPKDGEMVEINPATLRQAILEFNVSDGYRPSDRYMDSDVWSTALTTISTTPALQQEYNLGDMFTYLMTQQGAEIGQFKKSPEQRAYEDAVTKWQQAVIEASKNPGSTQVNIAMPKPQDFGYNPAQTGAIKPIPTGVEQ